MNLITAPINENSPIAIIQNLQDGLLQLLQWLQVNLQIARDSLLDEQRAGQYGGVTKELVANFQQRSALEVTGYVDQLTADAMNQLLRGLSALDEPDRFVVRGILRLSDNTPVPGVKIRAFDRDLRSRELLGETNTNVDGYYEIFYTRDQFSRAEKQTADLIVAAVEPVPAAMVAQFTTLAESPTLFNAPAIAEIDLMIAANIFQPPSEYARLIQALGDLLVNVAIAGNDQPTLIDKLADLNDEDLDFLFHETNIELEKLKFLTQSARLHKQFSSLDYSVPTPAFYGLARTKRLNDFAGFARSSIGELKEGLIQAGGIPNQPQQNIIAPFTSEEQLNQIAETIHSVSISHILNTPNSDTQPALTQVLSVALPLVVEQQTLLQSYANHDGTTEQFWDNLRQQETFQEAGKIEKIQYALQLNTLTQSNLHLAEQLQAEFPSTRSMAQMSPELLTTRLKALSPTAPADFPGDTPAEKLDLYTKSIVGLLQGAFPTETVAHVVSTVADTHLQNVAPTAISQFLNRATDSTVLETDEVFDLRSSHVERFVELHGDRLFADIAGDSPQERLHQRTQITQQVKRTQRLFQVSTSPETLKVLMESGFQSASQIAKQSFRTIQENLGKDIADEELKLIHERAIATSAASLQTALMAYQSATDPVIAAIGGGLKEVPNWANLFGSLELCECQHCRSLYSPAAYFVDLLEYLRNAPPNSKGHTPLDVLVGNADNLAGHEPIDGKRPDLPHIPLTCENTNTPIPYIDLVNEVLESYVALGKLDHTTAKDTGLSTAAELSANPQYVKEAAYTRLREAVFPISLPFDRSLAIARLYLDQLGSSRHEVMKAFDADANRLASEALGLSEKDFEILTGQNFQGVTTILLPQLFTHANEALSPQLEYDPTNITANSAVVILQAKLKADDPNLKLSLTGRYDDITQTAVIAFQQKFGLPVDSIVDADDWAVLEPLRPNAVGALITGVPEFLRRTELSYVELVDLLKTRFINPNQRSLIAADQFLKEAKFNNEDIRTLIANNFANPTTEIQAKLTEAAISLEQIQALLEPLRSTTIVLYAERSECELDKTLIQYLDGNSLTDADAWKLQRFIRLWRKLGWTMPELDSVLLSLGYPDAIPADCLQKLSHVKQLQTELNLTLPKLLSFWSNIETHGEKPLYKTLFQNKAVFNPPDSDFQLNEAQDELADPTKELTDKQPAILAALRIKASDLDTIIVDAQLPSNRLNLANLSALYRYAALSKALRLPIQDFITLKKLAGDALNPFTTRNPEPTLAFIYFVQAVKSSGFLAPQLDYLFRHQVVLPSKFPPQQASVETLLKTLRDGLNAITQDTQLRVVPDGELTRTKLGILFSNGFVDEVLQLIEGTAVYTQPLNVLPPGINFPSPLQKKIRYERKVLSFTGAMSDAEQTLLLDLSQDGNYQTAINQLHQQPRNLLSRADVINPSKPQEVRTLTNFLLDLEEAKTKLMNLASLNEDGQPILVDVNDNPTQSNNAVRTAIAAKFGYLLGKFLPYLRDIQSRSLIQQTLSQALQLDNALVEQLLTNPKILHNQGGNQEALADFLALSNLPVDQALPDDTLRSYERLYKIAMLVNTFNFSAAELEYWFSSDFVGFSLNALPIAAVEQSALFEGWQKLAVYVSLRNSLPQGVSSLLDVFKADDAAKLDRLSELTGWRKVDIEQAINSLGLGAAWNDVLNPLNLSKIQRIIGLSQAIGVPVDKLQSWTTQPADPDETADRAKAIKNAAKAKYTEEAWLEVSKPLSDQLREQQKVALIAYVLAMPAIRAANVTDSNRLFEYFLVDVEMCACMQTSRIKQAISSVQLFVQRCLLNLEPDVKPSAIDGDRWQWTKTYRVWEANRKVFLYPENWIEPELRDDKSPFFKELESELLQTDVTNEAAEKALLNYLYKLDQVARLEVCGMYLQEESDGKYRSILHVFARTMGGAIRSYYYRRLLDNKEWTPWEKVELDIHGVQGSDQAQEDGIHLLPVVWNRCLYLFWLVFTQKAEPPAQKPPVNPNNGIAIDLPKKYWEIQLAWSKYEQEKWTPKQISDSSIEVKPGIPFLFEQPKDFKLRAFLHRESIDLSIHRRTMAFLYKFSEQKFYGCFHLNNYTGKISTTKDEQSVGQEIIPGKISWQHFMGYSGHTALWLFKPSEDPILNRPPGYTETPILSSTPRYNLIPLSQNPSPSQSLYFYQDAQFIYFVRSREGYESRVRQLANPKTAPPLMKEKYVAPQSMEHLVVHKSDRRMESAVISPWVLAEEELVAQKITSFAARSGATLNQSL
jgi:peptidoglycan hydrolase-like protein with peptidoglycan-binding domain